MVNSDQMVLPFPTSREKEPSNRASAVLDEISNVQETCENLLKFRVDIEKSLCYDGHSHSFDDIVDKVLEGRLRFYPLKSSFFLMEVEVTPGYSAFHGFLVGGDLEEIMDAIPMMKQEGRDLGCKYASMTGRKGWEPQFKRIGWAQPHITMSIEL